eukprot:3574678-Ditylum_brightwellii.AAC.1
MNDGKSIELRAEWNSSTDYALGWNDSVIASLEARFYKDLHQYDENVAASFPDCINTAGIHTPRSLELKAKLHYLPQHTFIR